MGTFISKSVTNMVNSTTGQDNTHLIFGNQPGRYFTILILTKYAHILIHYNRFEFGDYMKRGSGDMDPVKCTKNGQFNTHY